MCAATANVWEFFRITAGRASLRTPCTKSGYRLVRVRSCDCAFVASTEVQASRSERLSTCVDIVPTIRMCIRASFGQMAPRPSKGMTGCALESPEENPTGRIGSFLWNGPEESILPVKNFQWGTQFFRWTLELRGRIGPSGGKQGPTTFLPRNSSVHRKN